METFYTKAALQKALQGLRQGNKKITLIPTMGALHKGHLSLIEFAKAHSDVTICSIFVNPTQFNDPEDLDNYPRPISQDTAQLESIGCDVLFLPSVDEMYPGNQEPWHIELNGLDTIWEGEHRPGHFQGVTQIVYKLLQLVQPDQACFGQKDFQQVMVIQHMIDSKALPVKLLICPTVRSSEGLALSSRNQRLSDQGKRDALALSKALKHIGTYFLSRPLPDVLQEAKAMIQASDAVRLEYLAVCDTTTLSPIHQFPQPGRHYVALVAAWVENVRLIDNILLPDNRDTVPQLNIKP